MEATTTFQNCTFYKSSEFMGNIVRHDCRDLTITTGQKYAQYNDAVKVEYTKKGARKRSGFWLTYKPFFVVLPTTDAIDPAPMLGEPTPGSTPDITIQVSRYSCCDDRWEKDFLAALADKKVQPLFQLVPEYTVDV